MIRSQKISIKNGVAMRAFGAQVARQIASPFSKGRGPLAVRDFNSSVAKRPPSFFKGGSATVVALVGDLGAGKTTFTQGFLKALGVKRRVISPTFLIIRPYDIKAGDYSRAFHIDCYRLNNSIELLSLGLREILKNPENIVLIEWPELIKKELPKNTKWIQIEHPKKGTHREVRLNG